MQGWIPELTGDGSWTLRHPLHGQACHSLAGAWEEAFERYARPTRLRELGLERRGGIVRLLDVGTGLGLNLAAARAELAGTGARLQAWTLESDPDVLEALIRRTIDVDQVTNYFAVNTLISHWDGFFNNYFLYHDAKGSGKWMMFPWDQDSTWGHRMSRGGEVFAVPFGGKFAGVEGPMFEACARVKLGGTP